MRNNRRESDKYGLTYLVGVLERPSVDAIVACVQLAFDEPTDIPTLERASPDSLKIAVPVERLAGSLQSKNIPNRGGAGPRL